MTFYLGRDSGVIKENVIDSLNAIEPGWREIVYNSMYWSPEVGPIYADDETMVPKYLLTGIRETRHEEKLGEWSYRVTYTAHVRTNP